NGDSARAKRNQSDIPQRRRKNGTRLRNQHNRECWRRLSNRIISFVLARNGMAASAERDFVCFDRPDRRNFLSARSWKAPSHRALVRNSVFTSLALPTDYRRVESCVVQYQRI